MSVSLQSTPGPLKVVFCKEAFKAALRIPLHLFIAWLLWSYGFVLAQIHPNAWRSIISYLIKYTEVGFSSIMSVMRGLMTLKKGPRSDFYYYASYRDSSLSPNQPKFVKVWILFCPPLGMVLVFSYSMEGNPRVKAFKKCLRLIEVDRYATRAKKEIEPFNMKSVDDELLFSARLCRFWSTVIFWCLTLVFLSSLLFYTFLYYLLTILMRLVLCS